MKTIFIFKQGKKMEIIALHSRGITHPVYYWGN